MNYHKVRDGVETTINPTILFLLPESPRTNNTDTQSYSNVWLANYKLGDSFKIDESTVNPRFEPKTETYSTESFKEEDIISSMLENDFIVKLHPVSEFTIRVRIKKVENGKLRIVEPKDF